MGQTYLLYLVHLMDISKLHLSAIGILHIRTSPYFVVGTVYTYSSNIMAVNRKVSSTATKYKIILKFTN